MRINDNMFVICEEQGMILNYLSLTDDGADMFAIGLGHETLLILKNKFRCKTFSWINNDKTLQLNWEDETMHLRFNNQKKHDVYLNREESLRMKSILVPSH